LRLLFVLLLTACAASSNNPPLVAPQWDAVPPPVLDALCARLQMDAIATSGALAVIDTTQPLATAQSFSALSVMAVGPVKSDRLVTSAAEANRTIPLMTTGTACEWRPIRAADRAQHRDEVIVELSAPAINPFSRKQAGLFARASLEGATPSWYWIALVPQGDRWAIGSVHVIVG